MWGKRRKQTNLALSDDDYLDMPESNPIEDRLDQIELALGEVKERVTQAAFCIVLLLGIVLYKLS